MRMEGCLDLGDAGVRPDGGERPVRGCVGGDRIGLFARGACGGLWAGVGGGVGACGRRFVRPDNVSAVHADGARHGPRDCGGGGRPVSAVADAGECVLPKPVWQQHPRRHFAGVDQLFPGLGVRQLGHDRARRAFVAVCRRGGGDHAVCERLGERVWLRARVCGGQR